MKFDIAIIGGGPGGYTAAEAAAKAGKSVVLFEKNALGGTCLNRGCIPTKALLHTAELAGSLKKAEEAGVFVEGLRVDFAKMHENKTRVVDTLRDGIAKLMKSCKVTVVNGEAVIAGEGVITCGEETYEAENIIVAAGSVPACPPIPGMDGARVYNSNDLLEGEGREFSSLVIIGGGVIGCEFASLYQALGCKVTILEAMDRLLPPMDKEIAQRLAMYFKKRGIAVNAKAMVQSIACDETGVVVTYKDAKGNECQVQAEGVLVATGRRANVQGVFSESMMPELVRGALPADENGKTALPGVYVIGDAKAANIQLAHVAEAQAKNAVAVICGKQPPVKMNLVPSCVYTSPEIASVGMTETQAKEAGIDVKASKYLTGANGKSVIAGAESGYVKIVSEKESGKILGAQMVCERATDMIAEAAVAISAGMKTEELAGVIHPHPTFCEMIKGAAE